MNQEIIQKLEQASNGLLMMSESDYPFTVVSWEGAAQETLTPDKVLDLTAHPQDTLVEIVDIDHFFRNCVVEKEWHDEQQQQDVKKFQELVNSLKSELTDIKVYRVGTINIDVYILGKNANDLLGVSTQLVET